MTRYVFEVVKYPASKRVPCAACGKNVSRSRTFDATINPFNLNENGDAKSYAEVRESLRQKAIEWVAAPDYCTPCLRAAIR